MTVTYVVVMVLTGFMVNVIVTVLYSMSVVSVAVMVFQMDG